MNKGLSIGLVVLAVVVAAIGLANHYALKMNPVHHTSLILAGVAIVLLVAGGLGYMMSGNKA